MALVLNYQLLVWGCRCWYESVNLWSRGGPKRTTAVKFGAQLPRSRAAPAGAQAHSMNATTRGCVARGGAYLLASWPALSAMQKSCWDTNFWQPRVRDLPPPSTPLFASVTARKPPRLSLGEPVNARVAAGIPFSHSISLSLCRAFSLALSLSLAPSLSLKSAATADLSS